METEGLPVDDSVPLINKKGKSSASLPTSTTLERLFMDLHNELTDEQKDLSRILRKLDAIQTVAVTTCPSATRKHFSRMWSKAPASAKRQRDWSVSSVLLIVAALTVANPTEDDAIFAWLVVLIITSATSDTLDQKLSVQVDGKFHPDLFWFKHVFWLLLELAELVARIYMGQLGAAGTSGNIHQLISYIGIIDASIGIVRIFIEGAAALLGPVNHQGQMLRTRYKFLPETKWNEAFIG